MAAQRKKTQLETMRQMPQPQHLPNQQPGSARVVKRQIEKKPKRSFYTLKMLLTVCGIGIFGLMFIQLYTISQINHYHYQMQEVRTNIERELSRNEQLNAQIAELSQYSRIIEIATARGLTLSENDVLHIEREK